jgi:hypothetical protein
MIPALAPLLLAATPAPTALAQAASTVLRPQTVAPLPGGLDAVLMLNDNNPELITAPGLLLSTFPAAGRSQPDAHLDLALSGRFDLFSHHVYAGRPETLDSTLWLAVLAQPRTNKPVPLRLLAGATALSQATDRQQASAPFLPLPALLPQYGTVFSGPGSRVATELLSRQRSPLLPQQWTLTPGQPTVLLVLPLPVRGLDPLLNGLNLQLRLQSEGPVSVATVAAFGKGDQPPPQNSWAALLDGPLSPREHSPTPRDNKKGPIIYSRVNGVQVGSTWRATITDPGQRWLSASRAPISWPISSLERGSLGTGQVQTAELKRFYPGTAWAAHGNYGVEYDLTIPLRNTGSEPVRLALALERHLSKAEILHLYLLLAPYGGNLEGIRAATLSYFGKEPLRLTPAEAAKVYAECVDLAMATLGARLEANEVPFDGAVIQSAAATLFIACK